MRHFRPTTLFLPAFFLFSSLRSVAQCAFTEADLIGAPSPFVVAAGQTLCINSNFCLGSSSNHPGTCANTGPNAITINGTLQIAANVTFKFQGSLDGAGEVVIQQAGRMSLFGSINCASGLTFQAVDPSITSGTSSTNPILSCAAFTCEPQFANGYAPFGVVANGLGYTASGCGPITGLPGITALPVTLAGFTARRDGEGVLLNWKTATEQDNAGFDVQRSTNGASWEAVGNVPSAAAGGNSNVLLNYSFRDPVRISTNLYYRLKQTDINGRSQLSTIVVVKDFADNNLRIFTAPGVINLEINSSVTQQASLKIAGAGGAIVRQAAYALKPGLNRYSVNTSNLPKGMYVVILQTTKETRQEKIWVP
ncbi:hypothetical protein [Paraflavitalea speifideaquila]|uniref:hypothetical protein n=1 Tax=Paraflavitalea speifideaquila TaxID=3076558 RepID=UPI0028E53398|nr:hypothetical protein [Paraflavitalea speifideiaquila]